MVGVLRRSTQSDCRLDLTARFERDTQDFKDRLHRSSPVDRRKSVNGDNIASLCDWQHARVSGYAECVSEALPAVVNVERR